MDRFLEEIVVKKNRTVNEILFVLSMVVMILTALYAVMMLQMLFYAFSVAALIVVLVNAGIAVALFLFFRKGFGQEPVPKSLPLWRESLYACGIGLCIGAYDGLVGPGTGTFLILCFTSLLGYDLILSSGCAKLANLASNLASLVLYWINGKVFLALAVPAALCCMLGGYLGARLAVRGGARVVRMLIFVVLGLLIVKTGWELLA